jgi:hypothetical protein
MDADGESQSSSSSSTYNIVDENGVPLSILTADEMMMLGVQVFFSPIRIKNVRKEETNDGRFNEHYGVSPFVASTVWEDLQTTGVVEARVDR